MITEMKRSDAGSPAKGPAANPPPRADQRPPGHDPLRRLTPLLCLAALSFCSCRSVTYDVRRLELPVLLSNNASLAGNAPGLFEVVNVDHYSATVSDAEVVASTSTGYSTTTTTQRTSANDAQVSAFKKVGGQQNRLIRGVSLDARFLAINGLVALAEGVSVAVAGDVAEIRHTCATNITMNTGERQP